MSRQGTYVFAKNSTRLKPNCHLDKNNIIGYHGQKMYLKLKIKRQVIIQTKGINRFFVPQHDFSGDLTTLK